MAAIHMTLRRQQLDPRAQPSRRRQLSGRVIPYAYLSPSLVAMAVLTALPVFVVIVYSLRSNAVITDGDFVGLANYRTMLADPLFRTATRNTLIYTIASVVFHLLIGMAFALLLNSRSLPTWIIAGLRTVYILPWVFTMSIVAILWRLILNPNGVVNYILQSMHLIDERVQWFSDPRLALATVTFIHIWSGYPFFMVSLLAGLQGISPDLYEAARVDGAGAVDRFRYITIPQLKPLILSMGVLDCIWSVQQFSLVWITTGGGPLNATETIGTYTYKLAFSKYQFSLAATSGVILLLFSMVLAIFYVRNQKARD